MLTITCPVCHREIAVLPEIHSMKKAIAVHVKRKHPVPKDCPNEWFQQYFKGVRVKVEQSLITQLFEVTGVNIG
jgi:DNA polymerase III delta subunit